MARKSKALTKKQQAIEEDFPLDLLEEEEEEEEFHALEAPVVGPGFDEDLALLGGDEQSGGIPLSTPPLVGGTSKSYMLGTEATTIGRATSPPMLASASQWPTVERLRVWKIIQGTPTAVGEIGHECSEEEFISHFYRSMPRKGEGIGKFQIRLLDGLGKELGQQFAKNISEHHVYLQQLRAEERNAMEEGRMPAFPGLINTGDGGAGVSSMSEAMSDMFSQALDQAQDQALVYRESLEEERSRVREAEKAAAEERIAFAQHQATAVEKMSERLLASDRSRSDETLKAQKSQTEFMMTMLTGMNAQSQSAMREEMQRRREEAEERRRQDREFYDSQRRIEEARRERERQEAEDRRQREREEARLEAEKRQREHEARIEAQRLEMEQRRQELLDEARRREQEEDRRRSREKEEWERRMELERQERERKERQDRERWEREKLEWERKREEARREDEKRIEERRRQDEERRREDERMRDEREARRREEMQLQMKQMEIQRDRDREHSEKMIQMAQLEREAAREAQERRAAEERNAREFADKERQRAFEMEQRRLETQSREAREHQERMMALQQAKESGGFGKLGELLGMDTPEVLSRIFTQEEGGWAESIPKILGGLAEAAGKVMPALPPPGAVPKQLPGAGGGQTVRIPAADGTLREYTLEQYRELQARAQAARAQREAAQAQAQAQAQAAQQQEQEPEEAPEQEEQAPTELTPYEAAAEINGLERAKEKGLLVKNIRAARKQIRALANQLKKEPEENWKEVVTGFMLLHQDVILPYLRAVSVWVALAETKVDPELAAKGIELMRGAEAEMRALQGSDTLLVPFDEEEWAAFHSESEAPAEGGEE